MSKEQDLANKIVEYCLNENSAVYNQYLDQIYAGVPVVLKVFWDNEEDTIKLEIHSGLDDKS